MNVEPSSFVDVDEERPTRRHWLREEEVMERLGVTKRVLRSWRILRSGPAFIGWNCEYVLYDPRSVAYFQRSRSPFSPWRRGHPWLPMLRNKE